jgi:hypothetical protein
MDADEERSQRVFVVSQTSTYRNAELREIWSVAVCSRIILMRN